MKVFSIIKILAEILLVFCAWLNDVLNLVPEEIEADFIQNPNNLNNPYIKF